MHYSGSGESRPPTGPVLKLWLRFRNVSDDTSQVFMPLGRDIVFNRGTTSRDSHQQRSNNFVYSQGVTPQPGKVELLFDHVVDGDWDLAGQNLDRVLKPGESLETYLPTSESAASRLTGDLVWRIHFRKGVHPATRHGVTTLIDVHCSRG